MVGQWKSVSAAWQPRPARAAIKDPAAGPAQPMVGGGPPRRRGRPRVPQPRTTGAAGASESRPVEV
eukprot:602163-Alexandrium_andersonii.AAC.1